MIRASVAAPAPAAALFLESTQGSARQVWPGSHLASFNAGQQAEIFQRYLLRYDPRTAQIALGQTIALQPGNQPHLSVHDREDAPAEFPGGVGVLGNNVNNLDILTVGPADNYDGTPTVDRGSCSGKARSPRGRSTPGSRWTSSPAKPAPRPPVPGTSPGAGGFFFCAHFPKQMH